MIKTKELEMLRCTNKRLQKCDRCKYKLECERKNDLVGKEID